jgi:biotin-(acetyl-CoA carboxylase) ligase
VEEFRCKNLVLGKHVCATRPDGSRVTGIAESIEDTGHLVIRTATGGCESLSAGEISLGDYSF